MCSSLLLLLLLLLLPIIRVHVQNLEKGKLLIRTERLKALINFSLLLTFKRIHSTI